MAISKILPQSPQWRELPPPSGNPIDIQQSHTQNPSQLFCQKAGLNYTATQYFLTMTNPKEALYPEKSFSKEHFVPKQIISIEKAHQCFQEIATDSKNDEKKPTLRDTENRYSDISPYITNYCAVPSPSGPQPVNASPHSGVFPYILTQGPLSYTLSELVQLAIRFNSTAIVTLANPIENDRNKTEDYWTKPIIFPDFSIIATSPVTTSTKTKTSLHERNLTLTYKEEKKTLLHLWMENWGDHQATNLILLDQLCEKIETRFKKDQGTLLIHCSAGVGRTGTLAAILEGRKEIREGRDPNLYKIIRDLRRSRIGMVQSSAQYQSIHNSLYSYTKTYKTKECLTKENDPHADRTSTTTH